jgi:hypothetical protein
MGGNPIAVEPAIIRPPRHSSATPVPYIPLRKGVYPSSSSRTPQSLVSSKRTPIPIPRHTNRNLHAPPRRRLPPAPAPNSRSRRARQRLVLPRRQRRPARRRIVPAVGAAAAAALPLLELREAVRAGARRRAARVVVGVLVEGHRVRRVRVAEDVAAAPAVVPPREVAELAPAGGVVADCGFVVGLLL